MPPPLLRVTRSRRGATPPAQHPRGPMTTNRTPLRRTLSLLALVPMALGLAACGGSSDASSSGSSGGAADELRLGYFANVTHAPALIGVQEKLFIKELG